jgi:hypothetical protein
MHVRIAWEIYNHQQKQKGDNKKSGESSSTTNTLVPSTSSLAPVGSKITPHSQQSSSPSSSLASRPPATSDLLGKRPAPGAPDFVHKRPATDADILRNQLFPPPPPPPMVGGMGPPPNSDPMASLLPPRPPYFPPGYGPSPLRTTLTLFFKVNVFIIRFICVAESALSPFPRFGSPGVPFGGLGSLRDSANALGYGGLVMSSAGEIFGLPRPGFPPLFTQASMRSPSSLQGSWPLKSEAALLSKKEKQRRETDIKYTPLPPPTGAALTPTGALPSLGQVPFLARNGSLTPKVNNGNGDAARRMDASRSPLRSSLSSTSPCSQRTSVSPVVRGDLRMMPGAAHFTPPSTSEPNDLSLKKEDEVTVVSEKLNNVHHQIHHHVPNANGRSSVSLDRPSSRHNTPNSRSGSVKPVVSAAASSLAASLARPPISSVGTSINPYGLPSHLTDPRTSGLAGLYPGMSPHAGLSSLFGMDPFRAAAAAAAAADPYRNALNPYMQNRESLLRLNQMMMTEQERIRMGISSYPPGMFPPPPLGGGMAGMLGGKPPILPGAPHLGMYPGAACFPPGFGAVSAASMAGLPPGSLGAPGNPPAALNGHMSTSGSPTTSLLHSKEHPLR